ncbi:ash family protein [Salmonella enterica]|uniref:ash family protein n=1 Tax=Salmonella enterica TaxID=28901 RepID=UPI003F7528BB
MSNSFNHVIDITFSAMNAQGEYINDLPLNALQVYVFLVPAKSGIGIGLPEIITATHDAPSVFFCVVHSVHPFFCDAVIIRAAYKIMVGCVGASSEAPVSVVSGKTNSAQSTTSKIGLFGGGYLNHTTEAASWLLSLPKIRNLSGLLPLFAAIVRQSSLFSIMLLLRLSVMLVALWCVITSVSLLAASPCKGCAMIKIYDLPIDPKERSANLISLALLMDEVLKGNADNRDEYLSALISLFEVYARDLHSLLEGHALPEVSQ